MFVWLDMCVYASTANMPLSPTRLPTRQHVPHTSTRAEWQHAGRAGQVFVHFQLGP